MNDDLNIPTKKKYPKKGILAVIGVIMVIGMLITPYGPTPTGNVSATWTNYGSYISTISSVLCYDSNGVLLANWTVNTHDQIHNIAQNKVITNVTVSGILRTTELAVPSDPRGCLDLDAYFYRNGVLIDTTYSYYDYSLIWLDSDDWYFIVYLTPSVEWKIIGDDLHQVGVKMRLYVP